MNTQHTMKSLVLALALPVGALFAGNDKNATIAEIAKTCAVKGEDKFHGYDRVTFDFKGHEAWIVFPKDGKAREGKPWTWTMQWATAFVPRTHVPQMLADGYHHVTILQYDEKMDERGIALSAAFQKFLVETLGFAPKANLIGMSWGGFFSVRYAAAHPENVRKIYLDAPLLSFQKFRFGNGSWDARMPADGLWIVDPEMPVNKTEAIAKAGIPVLLLYGGQDQTVPPEYNAELFEKRFKNAGGDIKVVQRGGFGHHPHGVDLDDTTIKDFFDAVPRTPVAKFPGEVSSKNGWTLVAQEAGKVVYIPFEGYYESKGGRIESKKFPLDKTVGETAYYQLMFDAKSATNGYWWVDFFDKDGNLLPDVNSGLYASADYRPYRVMVPVCSDAASAQIAFVSRKGVSVRDVSMIRVDADQVADWCKEMNATLPKLDLKLGKEAWEKLPNSKTAIKVGKEFNIVLLGDSIVNDSYCGMFTAEVERMFPDTRIRFDISVRGSTGCWYYQDEEHFKEYVAQYRPNLVVIGGISNWNWNKEKIADAEEAMVKTIRQCQALGAEVVVCTPPPSYEFRKDAVARPFDRALIAERGGERYLQQDYERRAAARTGVQVWDLTTAPCEAISQSGKPLNWFKRDSAHNDDRGKRLIAQTLSAYFQAAYNE